MVWINNMVIEENKSWACLEAIMDDYPDVTTMEFDLNFTPHRQQKQRPKR